MKTFYWLPFMANFSFTERWTGWCEQSIKFGKSVNFPGFKALSVLQKELLKSKVLTAIC